MKIELKDVDQYEMESFIEYILDTCLKKDESSIDEFNNILSNWGIKCSVEDVDGNLMVLRKY